jgi:hypothetical protein
LTAAAPIEPAARALDRLNARSTEWSALADESGFQGASASMKRLVLRLPAEDRDALDRLRAGLWKEARIDVSRADMMRFFVWCGLSAIDSERPLTAQLPVQVLRRAGLPSARQPKPRPKREGPSMRQNIVQQMSAAPGEVFTPAKLAPLVGASTRDSVRNTLLVLHAKGRIAKVGPGQYRAITASLGGADPARVNVLALEGGVSCEEAPVDSDAEDHRRSR